MTISRFLLAEMSYFHDCFKTATIQKTLSRHIHPCYTKHYNNILHKTTCRSSFMKSPIVHDQDCTMYCLTQCHHNSDHSDCTNLVCKVILFHWNIIPDTEISWLEGYYGCTVLVLFGGWSSGHWTQLLLSFCQWNEPFECFSYPLPRFCRSLHECHHVVVIVWQQVVTC